MDERNSRARPSDQALAVPVDPSRIVSKRQIHFVWAAGQTVRVVIPDGFRLTVLSLGQSPSVVPTELMPPGRYDLQPETLPGGSYPMALTTCDAAYVELTESLAPAQVDRIFAIAMEARRGETPESGSTAEGGDSAGRKASPKGSTHG